MQNASQKDLRIAFIMYGDASHAHTSVLNSIKKQYPGQPFDVINLYAENFLKKDPRIILHCVLAYGVDILLGRKTIAKSFLRTPYAFQKMKQRIRQDLGERKYMFTFQMQSLFDGSMAGRPHFVFTDHTHLANLTYPGVTQHDLFSKAWIECEKEIYQNATTVFTRSSNITKSVIEDYSTSPEKVCCVYYGFNAPVERDIQLDDARYTRKNILFIGRDWERKGGPELVEAFKQVLTVYPDASLTVLGCTPRIDLSNCHVLGNIPMNEVGQYYQNGSIFCMPTKLEPSGNVFLEAMSYKLPVVGTNVGAQPDFIQNGINGYLVEPSNSKQVADRLLELLAAPEKCKAMGEENHRLVWERYNWDKVAEKLRAEIDKHLSA